MANYTPNYNLYKPNKADNDINVAPSLDTNFTTIDTEIKKNATKVAEIDVRQVENIGYGVQSGLNVTASATPDMNVHVQTGVIYMSDGQRFSFSAVTTKAVTTADATNPRKDIIYVSSLGVITYLAGTAAATPTEPTLPSGATKLCVIDVPAADTTIQSTQITDSRGTLKKNLGVQLAETTPEIYVERYPIIAPETDDTARLNRAITAAGAKGKIIFALKEYNFSTTLSIPERVEIEGQGNDAACTKLNFTGTGYAIVTSGTHLRQKFRNFSLALSGTNSGMRIGDTGANLNRSTGILPRQIELENITITGLGASQYGIRFMNASHITMRQVRSAYGTGGIGVSIYTDCYNAGVFVAEECTFGRVDEMDVGLEMDGSATATTDLGGYTNAGSLDGYTFNSCYFGGKTPIKLGVNSVLRNVTFNAPHIECKGGTAKIAVELYKVYGANFNSVTVAGFSETGNIAFSFKDTCKHVNILGVEANGILGTIYKEEATTNPYNCILQEAALTGGSTAAQFSGTFTDCFKLEAGKMTAKSLQLEAQGDAEEILKLNIERAWSFIQQGTGSSSILGLKSLNADKTFRILDVNNVTALEVTTGASPSAKVGTNTIWHAGNTGGSGVTGSRPTSGQSVGSMFFDTTLGKPIFLKSSTPSYVWVDATGATV